MKKNDPLKNPKHFIVLATCFLGLLLAAGCARKQSESTNTGNWWDPTPAGGDTSSSSASDTFTMKGFYIGMPFDSALQNVKSLYPNIGDASSSWEEGTLVFGNLASSIRIKHDESNLLSYLELRLGAVSLFGWKSGVTASEFATRFAKGYKLKMLDATDLGDPQMAMLEKGTLFLTNPSTGVLLSIEQLVNAASREPMGVSLLLQRSDKIVKEFVPQYN